ncbi:MAG: hypothetical protein NTX45_27390 [Proteobacteria bacterium]|nr:hypothetical protein [Pseudomonadota bacterium]
MIHDKTLYIHDGEGKYVPDPSNLVIEEAKRRLGARLEGLNALTSPALARDAIRLRLGYCLTERGRHVHHEKAEGSFGYE